MAAIRLLMFAVTWGALMFAGELVLSLAALACAVVAGYAWSQRLQLQLLAFGLACAATASVFHWVLR